MGCHCLRHTVTPGIDPSLHDIVRPHNVSPRPSGSGFLQMAVNPSHIVKTAFVTKNGTYAFRRMPFGLSGNASNFRKAID
ncbi:hypothetical protein TNCV_2851941 [Trichonephila clavipes]|nr:hypothetical protein TNCV_2851941 [Trichonephila clavipes]